MLKTFIGVLIFIVSVLGIYWGLVSLLNYVLASRIIKLTESEFSMGLAELIMTLSNEETHKAQYPVWSLKTTFALCRRYKFSLQCAEPVKTYIIEQQDEFTTKDVNLLISFFNIIVDDICRHNPHALKRFVVYAILEDDERIITRNTFYKFVGNSLEDKYIIPVIARYHDEFRKRQGVVAHEFYCEKLLEIVKQNKHLVKVN